MTGQGVFSVPFSSSLPSTPGSRGNKSAGHANPYPRLTDNPSTTPAGPPPSSARSFTPVGPPPSSVFGSSQLAPGKTLFQSKAQGKPDAGSRTNESGFLSENIEYSKETPLRSTKAGAFGPQKYGKRSVKHSTPGRALRSSVMKYAESPADNEDQMAYGSSGQEEHDQEWEQGDMDVDSQGEGSRSEARDGHFQSSAPYDWGQHGLSIIGGQTPRSNKQSRRGAAMSKISSQRDDMQLVKQKDSAMPSIARDLAKNTGYAHLIEPDELIVETEKLVEQIYPNELAEQDQDQILEAALSFVPAALCKLWQSCCNKTRRPSATEFTVGIGPGDNEPSLYKATFLSSLLLKLHHPPAATGKQAFAMSRAKLPSRLAGPFNPDGAIARPEFYPKILLDWLDQNHNPYPTATIDLHQYYPNSTAHQNFWDIIFASVLRGKLAEVVHILKDSDFMHARTAREEGQAEDGYRGIQLGNITRVMNRAIRLLESCPALQDENWDTAGSDWNIFRKRVEQALSDLAAFAEGRDKDLDPAESTFEAENFGMRSTSKALSRSARRAESKVPWTIYQNLKTMYGLLLGGTAELISVAQDWVEATIGLTIWWDGDDDNEIAVGSLAITRRSLQRSQSGVPRCVDLDIGAAYQRRLSYSFERVTDSSDEGSFQIDSMNPVEVGLASVFEGNTEGVVNLLRSWSLPMTAAVIEISSQAGWYEPKPADGVTDNFDESDLMVLSYGRPEKGLSRDGILVDYAEELSEKGHIQDARANSSMEGWELSIQILTRIDDTSLANKKVGEILGRLRFDTSLRADKLIDVCRNFGLDREARNISEKYADSIAESSDLYGEALTYYARAHNAKKVKNVLDLLVSLCLVQSIAYPALSSLDKSLRTLITSPRTTLLKTASTDPEAADILQFHLSGYATLRRFYDLRDEEVNLKEGQKPTLRPIARKKAAAAALLTVIASAADNIQGGLYDDQKKTVVQIDGLLALLGEAIVFLDQPTRILALPQLLSLLTAIEDLQTVHPRIYAQCQDCLTSTLAAAQGSQRAPSPREMMKKSISDLTSSSAFSLVGSSMMEETGDGFESRSGSGLLNGKGKSKESGDKRGWDWRTGMKKGARGEDVLRILRLGLAREVARAWVDGEEV
ncbi:hypothetical protein MMC13_005094 [Lambiella insularis]|nr:hypothetical protein [Lambiella insularis]